MYSLLCQPGGISIRNTSLGMSKYLLEGTAHEDGDCGSLRRPKLTKRLKSENTSRFCPDSLALVLPSALEPVDGPVNGGVWRAPKPPPPLPPSAAPPPTVKPNESGSAMRAEAGLPSITLSGGSISSVLRNDVPSNSAFVLEVVTKLSRRLFCSAFGVPLRSRI